MYSATEAQLGHTLDPWLEGMVFNPFENFYQFVEESSETLLQLHELKKGGQYSVLVTTPGGLINYRMGDRIEILSERPLLFRMKGREKDEISIATEKINLLQLERALAQVSSDLGVPITDFVAWPEIGTPSRLVCGLSEDLKADAAAISAALDAALGERNPSYKEMRGGNLIYGPLRIEKLPSTVFYRYQERNLDRGQFKPKHLFQSQDAFKREYGLSG
jgi:hypothetical protein